MSRLIFKLATPKVVKWWLVQVASFKPTMVVTLHRNGIKEIHCCSVTKHNLIDSCLPWWNVLLCQLQAHIGTDEKIEVQQRVHLNECRNPFLRSAAPSAAASNIKRTNWVRCNVGIKNCTRKHRKDFKPCWDSPAVRGSFPRNNGKLLESLFASYERGVWNGLEWYFSARFCGERFTGQYGGCHCCGGQGSRFVIIITICSKSPSVPYLCFSCSYHGVHVVL